MLNVKQGGIKYHFLNLWYDSTWDWTVVSWDISDHSNHYVNGLINIFSDPPTEYLELVGERCDVVVVVVVRLCHFYLMMSKLRVVLNEINNFKISAIFSGLFGLLGFMAYQPL